jgi:hypothetical protein
MGRLGTRDDMVVYQQYVADLVDGVKKALVAVDPTPFFTKYGNNSWAAVKTYQDAQVDYAAAPVIKKYTGVLAAADVYTASTAFILLESIRLRSRRSGMLVAGSPSTWRARWRRVKRPPSRPIAPWWRCSQHPWQRTCCTSLLISASVPCWSTRPATCRYSTSPLWTARPTWW